MKQRDDPNQTLIDWNNPAAPAITAKARFPDPVKLAAQAPPPLVERLPWDFSTTFPQPTDEAIDAGKILDEDNTPEGIKAIHDEHAREGLAALHDLDAVLDARRRGVDPDTGKSPRTHASREKNRVLLEKEKPRLERHFSNLMEVYEDAFGPEAAQAFTRFLRAIHAGIPVKIMGDASTRKDEVAATDRDKTPPVPRQRRKSPTVLPVPKPLKEAVARGDFGEEEGKKINPSAREVHDITQQYAEKIIELMDAMRHTRRQLAGHCSDQARVGAEDARLQDQIKLGIEKYASSFGQEAADRLQAYCQRESFIRAGGHVSRAR